MPNLFANLVTRGFKNLNERPLAFFVLHSNGSFFKSDPEAKRLGSQ